MTRFQFRAECGSCGVVLLRLDLARLWTRPEGVWEELPVGVVYPSSKHVLPAYRMSETGPYACFWEVAFSIDPGELVGVLMVVHALDAQGRPGEVLDYFPSPYYSATSIGGWVR
jgi:hypothetical protein